MSVLAIVRPDEQNFPLFLHVLGAMVLVGGLLTGASVLAYARGDARLLRLGYWSLLAVSLPGWVLMRIGAQWIYTEEGWDDIPEGAEPGWLGIGFVIADIGGLILLVSLVVGGVGVYRLREGKGARLLKATLVLSLVLLAAYVVAVWAMAGKPE
jgi:formate hydrogenlyase subunit 3/multisubunit Na+/H+ antiporter MnhD subunit